MVNIIMENEASENHDWSRSSITWPRMGMLTRFVRRYELNLSL